MHLEILIEDRSGERMLEILIPKVIGDDHTFQIHSYRGIGHIPKNFTVKTNVKKRLLLNNLPLLLRGYGKAFRGHGNSYQAAVIVVCDLDDKCFRGFRTELCDILEACDPKPEACFCIAIEEGEAWFLGDIPAIKTAYPRSKSAALNGYINDSICGTWECLADAIYNGGSAALSRKGWQAIGAEKWSWAEKITPHMDVNSNKSPSFAYFCQKLREFADPIR